MYIRAHDKRIEPRLNLVENMSREDASVSTTQGKNEELKKYATGASESIQWIVKKISPQYLSHIKPGAQYITERG